MDTKTDWAKNINDMMPSMRNGSEEYHRQEKALDKYIIEKSDGVMSLDHTFENYMRQCKPIEWSYIFDVLKAAPQCTMRLIMKMPPKFKVMSPEEVYAKYDPASDAVLVRAFTGNWREDMSGYDGFGREPDEKEVVEGLRARTGLWVQPLSLTWI